MSGVAVVCGGGPSGLIVSRLLASQFEKVILVEARQCVPGIGPASELPQSPHVHHLLSYGLEQLAAIVPMFEDSLAASGAERLDHSKEIAFFGGSGLYPQRDFGITAISQARTQLDRILWQHIVSIDNIEVVGGAKVVSIQRKDARTIGKIHAQVAGKSISVAGDIFVDCTGTGLSKNWYDGSREGTSHYRCDVDLHYRSFAVPRFSLEYIRDCTRGLVVSPTRTDPRFLVIMPTESEHFLVTTGGKGCDVAAMDQSITRFIRTICDGRDVDLKRHFDCEPSRIARLAQFSLYWNRFEHWNNLPTNLFPVGDAFVTLSAIAGQGISLAIKQALALATVVPVPREQCIDAQRTYFTLAHSAVAPCWLLAIARESERDDTERVAPSQTLRQVDSLLELERLAYSDPVAHRRALLFRHYLGGNGLQCM